MDRRAARTFAINGVIIDVAGGLVRDREGREIALCPRLFYGRPLRRRAANDGPVGAGELWDLRMDISPRRTGGSWSYRGGENPDQRGPQMVPRPDHRGKGERTSCLHGC